MRQEGEIEQGEEIPLEVPREDGWYIQVRRR